MLGAEMDQEAGMMNNTRLLFIFGSPDYDGLGPKTKFFCFR